MSFPRRWTLILFLALGPGLFTALSADEPAFNAASKSFHDLFFPRAEKEFADFVQQSPASPLVPEARLFQAEARLQQTNYAGAIELLSSNLATAGSLAHEYLFWLGEAHLRKGDFLPASEAFGKLLKEQTASPHFL